MSGHQRDSLFDWFIDLVIKDTRDHYNALENRPWHRIGAMLCQCVPILLLMFLLVYVGWNKFDQRGLFLSAGETALLILFIALMITGWLSLVVLRDTCRGLYYGRYVPTTIHEEV